MSTRFRHRAGSLPEATTVSGEETAPRRRRGLLRSSLAGAGVALLLASGCSAQNGDSAASSPASASQSDSAQSEDQGTRTVTDIDGTEVKIPAKPQRIADLWHANNQIVLLLGGQDKLVATTQAIQKLPWFKVVDPGIASVDAPVTGTDVNMEELLGTNPDVVLASNKDQIDQARSAGIPAVRVDFQDFDGLKKTVDITADVIGTDDARDRAQKYTQYLDKNLDLVRDRLKDVSDQDKPSVLHIAGGSDLTKVDGQDSLIGEWMTAAGAKNSLDGVANLKNITMEEIVRSQPDTIIVGGTDSAQGIQKIKEDPAWANVPAVKNDRLIQNPVGTFNWDRYSAEEALQVLWAAKTFHPEKFQDVDLVSETRSFYRDYYGYDLTEDQAHRIIEAQAPAK